jgi:hypothetical protein
VEPYVREWTSKARVKRYPADQGVVEMGGRDTANTDHGVTESAIRVFYKYYAQVMDL